MENPHCESKLHRTFAFLLHTHHMHHILLYSLLTIVISFIRDVKVIHYVYTWILKLVERNQCMRIYLLAIMQKMMSSQPMLVHFFIIIETITFRLLRTM